ncbi:MAG: metallophosphoesterase [Thermoplasmata archaeon]
MIKIIMNERALYNSEKKELIISDLHIGIESEFFEKGIILPDSTDSMIKRIMKISEKRNVDRITILGDVKHSIKIPRKSIMEKIKNFFDVLNDKFSVTIVKGNHDGNIEKFIDAEIYPPKGYLDGYIYKTHGHTWPEDSLNDAKYLIMGHIHPEISIMNLSGKNYSAIWLIGKSNKKMRKYYPMFRGKIIVEPSFNVYTGMSLARDPPGPIFSKCLNIEDMDVLLLDHTYIGKFGNFCNKK